VRRFLFLYVRENEAMDKASECHSLKMPVGRSQAESILAAAGIDPMRRAETLSLEEWGKISEQCSVISGQSPGF
jgi:ribosomal protein S13